MLLIDEINKRELYYDSNASPHVEPLILMNAAKFYKFAKGLYNHKSTTPKELAAHFGLTDYELDLFSIFIFSSAIKQLKSIANVGNP